jgi:hypothetical protein
MGLSADELGLQPEEIRRRLADLGVGLGPPWTQDEKLASLIAWTSLARRSSKKKERKTKPRRP